MRTLLLLLLLCPALLVAQGGMWVPLHLKKQNEKEMKSLGCKLSADQIYNPDKPSVMDAICQFGGGCTAEVISPEGLILTNHHCGFGAIQSHSTLEHNYVDDGFWAKDRAGELACPGVTAMFVRKIEDVTISVLRDVSDNMGEKDRQSQIDKNIQQLKSNTRRNRGEELLVRAFYNGNQYFMFYTVTYKDVRLVGAPPGSIGKFGADTDNWVWPRHTGDFSLFRIYMGPDSMPAEFSDKNIPLIPRHYLPISISGVSEGDFTMVYGFPGRTDEYLTAAAVQQTGEVLDPARVAIRDKVLKTMDGFMRQDKDIKIAYIAKQSGIANSWKKWLGEMQGLKNYGALEKKRTYEADFTSRVNNNVDWKYRYGNLLPRLNEQIKAIEPYAFTRDYYSEVFVRNCEIMGQAAALNPWLESFKKQGEGAFAAKIPQAKSNLDEFYKDFRPVVDKAVFEGVMDMYAQNVRADWGGDVVKKAAQQQGGFAGLAKYVFDNSALASKDKMMALLAESPAKIYEALDKDPAIVLWREATAAYQTNCAPKISEIQPSINLMQRQYMAAQMDVMKDRRFFPDANSTLRVTYGQVRGFRPRDGIVYDYRTYLDGVMEKYVPGDYEFDVPKKLIDLWKSKDYGRYATADGRMPVAFLGSNHTTGGNSGSPALDARGNLVGLNFDRVWEGTMSDLNYDPAVCRNIMVDIRYVLFIIDKYAGATHLINEMKIVKKK